MILLDTHTWIWWYNEPTLLSTRSHELIENQIKQNEGIYISCISAWEVALLTQKKKLELHYDLPVLINETEKIPFIHFIPVNNEIFVQSVTLPDYTHKDPADRIILATALLMNSTLVTKDDRMHQYSHVNTDW